MDTDKLDANIVEKIAKTLKSIDSCSETSIKNEDIKLDVQSTITISTTRHLLQDFYKFKESYNAGAFSGSELTLDSIAETTKGFDLIPPLKRREMDKKGPERENAGQTKTMKTMTRRTSTTEAGKGRALTPKHTS